MNPTTLFFFFLFVMALGVGVFMLNLFRAANGFNAPNMTVALVGWALSAIGTLGAAISGIVWVVNRFAPVV